MKTTCCKPQTSRQRTTKKYRKQESCCVAADKKRQQVHRVRVSETPSSNIVRKKKILCILMPVCSLSHVSIAVDVVNLSKVYMFVCIPMYRQANGNRESGSRIINKISCWECKSTKFSLAIKMPLREQNIFQKPPLPLEKCANDITTMLLHP